MQPSDNSPQVVDNKFVPTTYQGTLEPNYYCRHWNEGRQKYCRARAGLGTDHKGVGRCKFAGGATPIKSGIYSVIKRPRIAELIQHFESIPEGEALKTFPELAAARALFTDWVERYDEVTEALLVWHASYSEGMRPLAGDMVVALEDLIEEVEVSVGESEEGEAEEDSRLRRSIKLGRRLLKALQTDPNLKPRQVPDLADGHKILDTISKIVARLEQARAANAISRSNLFRLMGEMGRIVEHFNGEPDPEVRLKKIQEGWLSVRLP